MLRLLTASLAVSLLMCPAAMAEETKGDDFAQYGITLSGSPFGGAFTFMYNTSSKTSWFFSMGGAPEGDMDLEVGDTEYTVTSSSAWMGGFIHHRPFDSADWFRLGLGIGIGNIENTLTDGDGNSYQANYRENPVGYAGIGFGAQARKGFIWGLDIGLLYTSGPDIAPKEGTPSAEAMEDIKDSLFFGPVLPNFQLSMGWAF